MTKQKTNPTLNPAEQYIQDVLSGKQVVSEYVRKAVERHQNDLKTCKERNLRFDRNKAQHVITFLETFCKHSQGKWAGTKISLEPWQQAMLWILYGWRWADTGYRRFKYAYIEIAKGNGKSFLCSGLGVYELMASGEAGAEVYSVATTKEQAKIVFSEAERMVSASPALKSRITNYRNNLHIKGSASKFQPLSSETGGLDGIRPQCFIVEEIHRWGTNGRDLWDVLSNALGKRSSPILICITTSGAGEETLCRQQNRYTDKVLNSVHPDDSWFGWICGLDPDDDYLNPAVWIKANPNLGVSVDPKELAEAINKAKGDPASLNGVLRLRLGVWTQSHSALFDMEQWALNFDEALSLETLKKQPCIGGLDLSTTTDISAFVLLFPPYGDRKLWAIIPYFFLPEDAIDKRSKRDRVPYDVWERQELFKLTSGNVIDYDFIRARILKVKEEYDLREIAYDPWNAQETATWLQDQGIICSPVRQSMASLCGPTKRLSELILRHELHHYNNPVLRWMASNCVADTDGTGSFKINKDKSSEKIDGISALVCALSRAMVLDFKPKVPFKPFFM